MAKPVNHLYVIRTARIIQVILAFVLLVSPLSADTKVSFSNYTPYSFEVTHSDQTGSSKLDLVPWALFTPNIGPWSALPSAPQQGREGRSRVQP